MLKIIRTDIVNQRSRMKEKEMPLPQCLSGGFENYREY